MRWKAVDLKDRLAMPRRPLNFQRTARHREESEQMAGQVRFSRTPVGDTKRSVRWDLGEPGEAALRDFSSVRRYDPRISSRGINIPNGLSRLGQFFLLSRSSVDRRTDGEIIVERADRANRLPVRDHGWKVPMISSQTIHRAFHLIQVLIII